jgi:FAD/FMN-containing dehydrogenase
MTLLAGVTRGMATGRGVTAADATAGVAHPQVHPSPAGAQALLAAEDRLRELEDLDLIEVRASRHESGTIVDGRRTGRGHARITLVSDAIVVPRAADGLYHPASEEELVALVRVAQRDGRQLRVRGAGHSPEASIGTDTFDGVEISLDRYRQWWVVDEQRRLVEVQAGIHLGRDAHHPSGTATLRASLLFQLWNERGWALSGTGGISHQTVSGFLSTGSAGGSVQYSVANDVWAVRLIDGRGEVHTFSREDADRSRFDAVFPSVGVLGVISTVTLRCTEAFTISGQEAITSIEGAEVDLFGEGSDERGRPSLAQYFREVEYSRVEWWPQRGAERMLLWQAQRTRMQPGFRPVRYEEFTAWPVFAEPVFALLFVIFGNLGDLEHARDVLRLDAHYLDRVLRQLTAGGQLSRRGHRLARVLQAAVSGTAALVPRLAPLAPRLERAIPSLFPRLLDLGLPLDTRKRGMHRGEPQAFRDWSWQGLPMDDQASDVLLATEFTELWTPLDRAGEVMRLLRDHFDAPADPHESYARTGLYAYELYASPPLSGWLHPAYSDGADEWRDGAFRLDVYWFAATSTDPHEHFFPQFWWLLRERGIPFRLHWGKHQPRVAAGDRTWVDHLARMFPRWEEFLALRAELDPDGVFLTRYWRDRFGLWED